MELKFEDHGLLFNLNKKITQNDRELISDLCSVKEQVVDIHKYDHTFELIQSPKQEKSRMENKVFWFSDEEDPGNLSIILYSGNYTVINTDYHDEDSYFDLTLYIKVMLMQILKTESNYREYNQGRFLDHRSTTHVEVKLDDQVLFDTRDEKYKRSWPNLKIGPDFVETVVGLASSSNIKVDGEEELLNLLDRNRNPEDIKSFSDYQLAILCKGMLESSARKVGVNYFEKNGFTEEEREKALLYVNLAKTKYGTALLKACLQLPSKPFTIENAERIFTRFDNIDTDTRKISLAFDKQNEFEFYLKSKSGGLSIKHNGVEVARFKRDGSFNIQTKNRYVAYMSATLFLSYCKNEGEELMFYGAKTGNCSYCKRPLDHPTSLLYGYGPVCAKIMNLPWG